MRKILLLTFAMLFLPMVNGVKNVMATRDTYFDCPDRERAQWWGDATVLMGESFYTYSISAHHLMRKAIRELCDWQRGDNTLFAPIPAGNYDQELPAQMLTSVGNRAVSPIQSKLTFTFKQGPHCFCLSCSL